MIKARKEYEKEMDRKTMEREKEAGEIYHYGNAKIIKHGTKKIKLSEFKKLIFETRNFSWKDVVVEGDKVFINGDYYGTEKEFHNDIDSGKLEATIYTKPPKKEQQLSVKIVGVDGSILTVKLIGTFQGIQLNNLLDTDMDGNYAVWHEPAPPIEIGSKQWDELLAIIDENPKVQRAIEKFQEGE